MHLTPEDIVNQELKTGLRGYVVADVDALLDRLADQVEHTDAELARLRDEVAALQARLDEAARHEAAVSRTLVTAQEAAERTEREAREDADRLRAQVSEETETARAQARAEAEELVRQAHQEAGRVRREAAQERAALHDRIAHLLEAETTHRDQLRRHLQEHLARLDNLEAGPAHAALEELDRLEQDAGAGLAPPTPPPTPATDGDAAQAEALFQDAARAAAEGEPTGPPLSVRVHDDAAEPTGDRGGDAHAVDGHGADQGAGDAPGDLEVDEGAGDAEGSEDAARA